MFVRDLSRRPEIVAVDEARLRELYNPLVDPLDVRHSLAVARVAPGRTTRLHRLEAAEVYYVVEGRGRMTVGGEEADVSAGQAVYVPPGAAQRIANTGEGDLVFLCIVDPPWRAEIDAPVPGQGRDDGEAGRPGRPRVPRRPVSEVGFVTDVSDVDFGDDDDGEDGDDENGEPKGGSGG